MNCTETVERPESSAGTQCLIEMPLGLLGFEHHKRFTLATNPEEEPFLWLQAVSEPKLSFLVISPFAFVPAYQPELTQEDEQFLELQGPDDTLVFAIVSVRNAHQATLNLKGPIVMNRRTLRAKQVIPLNAPHLPVAHPLPVQPA
jgi:flagellar assembly factor FliW